MEKIQNKKKIHGVILGTGALVSAGLGASVTRDLSTIENYKNLNLYQFVGQDAPSIQIEGLDNMLNNVTSTTSFVQDNIAGTITPEFIEKTQNSFLASLQLGLEPWQTGLISGLISGAILVGVPATIFAIQKHKLNKLSKQVEAEK